MKLDQSMCNSAVKQEALYAAGKKWVERYGESVHAVGSLMFDPTDDDKLLVACEEGKTINLEAHYGITGVHLVS